MLETDEQLRETLELAYRYLNRRERTVAEIRTYLERNRREPESIEQAIEQLEEQRFLDDARYAQLFVEDKRALEQWGSERIERALRERGIERDLIADALGAQSSNDELDRALELLRRRFPDPPRERRERDRALGVLVRKGYDSELALDAIAAHAGGADGSGLR